MDVEEGTLRLVVMLRVKCFGEVRSREGKKHPGVQMKYRVQTSFLQAICLVALLSTGCSLSNSKNELEPVGPDVKAMPRAQGSAWATRTPHISAASISGISGPRLRAISRACAAALKLKKAGGI
jgi:hypothetical protein